jgi:hypothetical protein
MASFLSGLPDQLRKTPGGSFAQYGIPRQKRVQLGKLEKRVYKQQCQYYSATYHHNRMTSTTYEKHQSPNANDQPLFLVIGNWTLVIQFIRRVVMVKTNLESRS